MPSHGIRFFIIMRTRNKRLVFILAILGSLLVYLLTRPYLFVCIDTGTLLAFPTWEKDEISLRFIHSVQKTPLLENLLVNESCDGLILQSTKYQSFGVGLPFLADEGEFKQADGYFVLNNMNRRFKTIELRTGLGTELTVIYHERQYPIYQELPLGCKVELKVVPYYRHCLERLLDHC